MTQHKRTQIEVLANTMAMEVMDDPRVQAILNSRTTDFSPTAIQCDEDVEHHYYAVRQNILHKLLAQMQVELAINY